MASGTIWYKTPFSDVVLLIGVLSFIISLVLYVTNVYPISATQLLIIFSLIFMVVGFIDSLGHTKKLF